MTKQVLRRGPRWVGTLGVLTAAVALALPTALVAADTSRFSAETTGTFRVTDLPDRDPSADLFVVKESGQGTSSQGAMSYALSAVYDAEQPPERCSTPANSSTAVDGTATVKLPGGTIELELVAGTSCFSFPTVDVVESWTVVGGTRSYRDVSGDLTRHVTGDVRTGQAAASWRGKLATG